MPRKNPVSQRRIHPFPDKIVMRTSNAWLAVKFAAFFRAPFTYADLHMMNPVRFPLKGRGKSHNFSKLVEWGILDELQPDMWRLTPFGVQYFNQVSLYVAETPTRLKESV